MAYTVTAIDPVLGGQLLRVKYTQDGGAERRAFFSAADLRRTTNAMSFEDALPMWARARAAASAVKLKDITLEQFRTLMVGQTIPAVPTIDAAKIVDGV